ncbi:alpha/beta hydrolase [Devriesea agamarum]|uniref:alpha/beta hydrolase n=1 Tax=Devriesea agamarum TaxID=472569 RepID=UPI00071CAEBB|nr:alpha/beta hydrolase-fold protein [Devriesea agamarum]
MGPFDIMSPALGWIFGIAAVIVFLLGIIVAPRLLWLHRKVGGIITQVIVVVLLPVLVMMTVFLAINRANQMFPTWSDLLSFGSADDQTSAEGFGGTPGKTGHEIISEHDADKGITALQRNPVADPAFGGAVKNVSTGQWVTVTVPGKASDVTNTALVYLPSGYMQNPNKNYPVILAFPGIPGAPEAWIKPFPLGPTMDDLVKNGEMRQAIVVSPNVYPGSNDTECVDPSNGKNRWETWITQDVVNWTKTHMRTIKDPKAWATLGYSAGGWCASMVTVRHPNIAPTAITLAGYFEPDYAKGQAHTSSRDPKYNLPDLVRHHKPAVSIYFFSGGKDDLPRASLLRMRNAVSAAHGPTALTVEQTKTGGHFVNLWVNHLPNSLKWLAKNASYFATEK